MLNVKIPETIEEIKDYLKDNRSILNPMGNSDSLFDNIVGIDKQLNSIKEYPKKIRYMHINTLKSTKDKIYLDLKSIVINEGDLC